MTDRALAAPAQLSLPSHSQKNPFDVFVSIGFSKVEDYFFLFFRKFGLAWLCPAVITGEKWFFHKSFSLHCRKKTPNISLDPSSSWKLDFHSSLFILHLFTYAWRGPLWSQPPESLVLATPLETVEIKRQKENKKQTKGVRKIKDPPSQHVAFSPLSHTSQVILNASEPPLPAHWAVMDSVLFEVAKVKTSKIRLTYFFKLKKSFSFAFQIPVIPQT